MYKGNEVIGLERLARARKKEMVRRIKLAGSNFGTCHGGVELLTYGLQSDFEILKSIINELYLLPRSTSLSKATSRKSRCYRTMLFLSPGNSSLL